MGLLPRALAIQAANAAAPANPVAAAPPTASLAGPYVQQVGTSIELDARGSAAGGGRITQYEWDLNGDGSYDVTTTTPRVTADYADQTEIDVTVRVTQTDGQTATTTASVLITSDGDSTPEGQDNCALLYNYSQTDVDGDGIGDDCDDTPGYPTADAASLYFHGPDGVLQRVGSDPADLDAVPVDTAGTSVTLDDDTVAAGQHVTVTASGFAPGDTADVWIASEPVVLATATIAADGTMTGTVEFPSSLDLGAHRIYVTAPATVASAPVTIAPVGSGSGGSGELAASGAEMSLGCSPSAPWPCARASRSH